MNHIPTIPMYIKSIKLLPFLALFLSVPANADFNDVPSHHINNAAISYVQEKGIVQGYSDGTFRPDQEINRAEFTKIVTLHKFGQKMVDMCGSRMMFSDVSNDSWYLKYICRAHDANLINGYPDNTFRPSNSINFVEAAKIIANANAFNDSSAFDGLETNTWYEQYVRYLANKEAIPVSINSFDNIITRGDMAEIIYRLSPESPKRKSRSFEEFNWNTESMSIYKNEELGIKFSYPKSWDAPISNGSEISFGPFCETCAEGTGESLMHISEVDSDNAINKLADIINNKHEYAKLVSNYRKNNYDIFIWEEGGMCGYRQAYVFNNYRAIHISGICLGDDPIKSALLKRIAETVEFESITSPQNEVHYQNEERNFSLELPRGTREVNWETTRFNLPVENDSNLNEKFLIIATGANETSGNCRPPMFRIAETENVNINGINYVKESGSDGGMSQLWESIRYVTGYPNYSGSVCVSFTFTLHSTNRDVLEPPPALYNKEEESKVFDEIMESVKFD